MPLLPVTVSGGDTHAAAPAAETATLSATAPATPALADANLATLYFESGSAALPGDAGNTLAAVVQHLKDDPSARAVVSGYHDASGDPALNAELAKQRAQAVAETLTAAGIDSSRVDLEKPMLTTGDGNADQARRVEVTVK
ncbi:MAG: OmpA family protein [Thermomonas sp.]|uniref:OmpA family protein n=1 Tax=Thermomonas sp. TaxID=1971895 RepID=UPI0039E6D95C